MEYEFHEFAGIFPLMEGKEYEELKRDIETHGILQPIVICEEKILDGRNRYRACFELKIEPKFEYYRGKNPLEYVISLNLKRRHLTESQRAVIALDVLPFLEKEAKKRQLSTLKKGDKLPDSQLIDQRKGKSTEQASKMFNVNREYIHEAKKLKEENPELLDKVRKGEKTLSEIKNEKKKEDRKQFIENTRKAIAEGKMELPKGTYEVIVIDPPWDYGDGENPAEKYEADYYMGRVVKPYPPMAIEQIKNIKIPSSENCVLWLWTTHKFIFECRDILNHWGFKDVSILTWVKDKIGIGKWLRSQTEYCIMAIKGKPIINLTNQSTVLYGKARDHSRKPEEFYKFIDELCIGRKIDYFAREKREGWDMYGIRDK
jgi:N6-adenosine-specific RNA methylase IME4